MLTQMVHALAASLGCPTGPTADVSADLTPDPAAEVELLKRSLPLLIQEHQWWMRDAGDGSGDGTAVLLPAEDEKPAAVLNRYAVRNAEPRPESWREDMATAEGLTTAKQARTTPRTRKSPSGEVGWVGLGRVGWVVVV